MARLISPIVNPQNSAHCMTFWYHMSGPHVGTLRIKLRYPSPEDYDQVLLTLSGNQGNCWKEGRVLLHKSVKHYQVGKKYKENVSEGVTAQWVFHAECPQFHPQYLQLKLP